MKREESTLLAAVLGLAVILMLPASGFPQEVPKISKEEVHKMLGHPDVIIMDVRKSGELKIKGAVREDPEKLFSRTHKYPKNKTLILYCA